MKPQVVLSNVSLMRAQQSVLEQINLQLSERRIGIIGYNGSGKSSILRLLCGLMQPDSGTITVGEHCTSIGAKKLCRTIGLIFQNPDHQLIFPTVIEELSFGLRNIGYSKAEAIMASETILADYQRSHWRDKPVASLSEGQKQLLCILSILLMQPSTLLFDEPYSALDYPTRQQLAKVIANLDQQVIMVSHEPHTFAEFERVIWLADGKVQMDGQPTEVIRAYEANAEQRNHL
ncbi:energy-coupling factor ABC transporter ATP-binding protein [Salinibius halmophilus]|uniref:energy-coupling factor ABC transporter ATP-binding protein n=1 Tax=Salinibius halmophilus TaxID=1853216 RepID=UPI000E672EB1|nr:ABC transporter ATP-binding protein [Salinibius halmophilus]